MDLFKKRTKPIVVDSLEGMLKLDENFSLALVRSENTVFKRWTNHSTEDRIVHISQRRGGWIAEDANVSDDAFIGKGAIVKSRALVASIEVGERTIIGRDAVVNIDLGEDCEVGDRSIMGYNMQNINLRGATKRPLSIKNTKNNLT